jgi:hypothetical protein
MNEASPLTMKRYRQLRMSIFEQVLIVAMLLTLTIAGVDALDGQKIGKSDALTLAKMQGQQELMASTSR